MLARHAVSIARYSITHHLHCSEEAARAASMRVRLVLLYPAETVRESADFSEAKEAL